ncbi:MAG TPA: alpha/beta hydrolase, partial [Gemmatales bacterium]|nr:alpha/beta hydrolase [Gemmatales bacterium]
MTPPPTCGSPAVAPKLTLVEALNRMEREARTGLLDTGRYRCRFLEWGEGPPLVFIHGLGDVPRSFALVMAQLSRHFRCIAYHQPTGSGDLARLRRYRHQHLLDDFFRLADHLRLEGGAVVGHSFGTTIALKALHDQPERFRRGVLACGFAHRPLTRSHWWLGAMARLFPVGPRLVHWRARNEAMRRLHYRGFEHVEPDRWQFFLDQTGQTPIVTMGHWGHVLHHLDLRPLVPRIRQPLLLVCGDDDRLVPHQVQMQLFDQLPNAVMFQITGCGHMPTLTHPEAFAQAVLTFSGQGDLGTPIGHGLHGCGGSGPDERGLCPASAQPCA